MKAAMKLASVKQTPVTRPVLEVAHKNHLGIRLVGLGDVPERPVFRDGWWYEPLTAESTLPAAAVKRAQTFLNAGIRPQGFVIAHETSSLLPAPRSAPQVKHPAEPWITEAQALAVSQVILKAVVVAGGWALLALGILAQGILLDPALIMVMDDGTMIEIARWYE